MHDSSSPSEEILPAAVKLSEQQHKLLQMKSVLERWGTFSGIDYRVRVRVRVRVGAKASYQCLRDGALSQALIIGLGLGLGLGFGLGLRLVISA